MHATFPQRSIPIVACLVLFANVLHAQRPGSRGTSGPSTSPVPGADLTARRPVIVSGRVMIEGGLVPTEPIAIERSCNGARRREGYTDNKGQFQFQLGSGVEQDVSENDSATGSQQPKSAPAARVTPYEGCELHALLTGFRSSSVTLHILQDDFADVKVGTIVLTRLQNEEGANVSLTTLAAPREARDAYERARKAAAEKNFTEAVDALHQAVQAYPKYSAAWYMLGEIHRQRQPEEAKKEYTEAIAADPQFVNPYLGLVLIDVEQKQWEEVRRLTDQVIRLNAVAFPLAYFYNSAANYNLGQLDVAEQAARKFITIDSEHRKPEICLILASILHAKHDSLGAAQQLRAYLSLVPDTPIADQLRADAQQLERASASPEKE